MVMLNLKQDPKESVVFSLLGRHSLLSTLTKQMSALKNSLLALLILNEVVEPNKVVQFYSGALRMLIQPLGTLLGVTPAPQKRLAIRILDSIWRRQWLLVILCGTIAVPLAFYVASIVEGVSIVEYTRLATLSWLSFFAGAVLNKLRK